MTRTFAQGPKATLQTTPSKFTIPGRAHLGHRHEVSSILHLQRTIGNQAVLRLLQTYSGELEVTSSSLASPRFGHDFSRMPIHSPAVGGIQTKSAINQPGDEYEQEADHISEQVLRMPEPQLQRACACGGGCPRCQTEQPGQEHQSLQAKHVGSSDSGQAAAPPIVHEVLASPGQPLDPATRAFMEPRFGHAFSTVRVHADARASESARAVKARAYTHGQDVVFGAGQFVPETNPGKSLLAHELTHVVQQSDRSPVLQRKPDEKAQGAGDLQLPWKHGDYSLFEEKSAGIRFLAAMGTDKEKSIRTLIPAIGKRIAADNATIQASSRVTICIIAPTTTRFALWQGKPVLMIDPSDAGEETVAHEMGHAIFEALKGQAESKTKDAAKARNFRLSVADIYARLSQTKDFTEGNATHPAGLWIADPSQWIPGGKSEHPWDDPDEFFASAKAAYQINHKGFEGAIAKFKKFDPAVGAPAQELLALLDAFFKKRALPSKGLPEVRASAAETELERGTGVSKVEDTVMSDTPLDWLLNPGNRPKQQKARPSIESPY
jgi:hypothetical protein